MPSQWNMFVKKIYEEGHAKDANYQFKDALKDASKRKGEMSKMKPMAATRRMKKSMSQKKSKAAKGGADDEEIEVEETEVMEPRNLEAEFDAEMDVEEEKMEGGKRRKRGGSGRPVGLGNLGAPLDRALMAGGRKTKRRTRKAGRKSRKAGRKSRKAGRK